VDNKRLFLLFLAVLALSIISLDYTHGHTLNEEINLEYCPICDAFQSTEIGVLLLYIVILIGFVPILCYPVRDSNPLVPSLFCSSISPDRAPPVIF